MSVGLQRSQSLRYPRNSTGSISGSRRSTKGRCRSLRRLDGPVRLSAYQQQALRTSWKALRPSMHGIIRKILNDLENEIPKVKQIFCKAAVLDAFNREGTSENLGTLEEHVKLMAGFFDDLVNNVEDEGNMSNKIKKIGQTHAILSQSSFNADIWEKLGEIAMECFSSLDAVQKTREAGKAWRILFAWITDELRCGFDDEARAYSRYSPTPLIVEQQQSFQQSHRYSTDAGSLHQQMRQMRLEYKSTVPL